MRRRLLLLVVIMMTSIFFSACRAEGDKPQTGQNVNTPANQTAAVDQKEQLKGKQRSVVTVWWKDAEGKYLLPINIFIEPTEQAANAALEKLLDGVDSELVRATIPANTKLRELYLRDNTAYVDLTADFLQVSSGLAAQQAVDAMVLTLTEFPMVKMVQILVDGQLVEDFYGISLEEAFSRPKAVNGPEYENSVLVYYADANAVFVVPYPVEVKQGDPLVTAATALLAEPPVDDLIRSVWMGTKLLDLEVNGDTVTVDFSKEVVGYGGGSTSENILVNSLVATMTQFEGITQVQLLIEGEKQQALPEGTDISQPLTANYNTLVY